MTASSVEELIKLIKAAYSEKSDDRFEKSDKNDDALKIDRVDFSGGKAQPAYEQYVPSAVPEESIRLTSRHKKNSIKGRLSVLGERLFLSESDNVTAVSGIFLS